MEKKSSVSILILLIVTNLFVFAPAQSLSNSVTITATGNPATTYTNPSVPSGWPFGDTCTEDVFNIVNAVLGDNVKTIYLQNGPNGEEFIFDGNAPFVWVTKPKKIIGIDDRVPNDGSVVPLEYSATVPATKINHNTAVPPTVRVPVFAIGGSGVTIRNLWLDSDNGGIVRYNLWGVTWMLPPNPTPYGDITIEDNVLVTKKFGLSIWEIECGLNIINNYIDVQGTNILQLPDESWTAIMVWCQDSSYGTEDNVNVVSNYIKFNKAWWAVELGGPRYTSRRTRVLANTLTGSLAPNYASSFGDASLSLKSTYSKFIVTYNHFVDIDAPDGCALLLRGVKDSLISNNEFKNIQAGEPEDPWTGAIFCTLIPLPGIEDPYTRRCKIIANDYQESGLPGWDVEVGCILLTEYTEDNFLVEEFFPDGTSASNQILDLTDDPTTEEYDGNNKLVGVS